MLIYLLFFAGLLFTVFIAVLLLRHRTCPHCQKKRNLLVCFSALHEEICDDCLEDMEEEEHRRHW